MVLCRRREQWTEAQRDALRKQAQELFKEKEAAVAEVVRLGGLAKERALQELAKADSEQLAATVKALEVRQRSPVTDCRGQVPIGGDV